MNFEEAMRMAQGSVANSSETVYVYELMIGDHCTGYFNYMYDERGMHGDYNYNTKSWGPWVSNHTRRLVEVVKAN